MNENVRRKSRTHNQGTMNMAGICLKMIDSSCILL